MSLCFLYLFIFFNRETESLEYQPPQIEFTRTDYQTLSFASNYEIKYQVLMRNIAWAWGQKVTVRQGSSYTNNRTDLSAIVPSVIASGGTVGVYPTYLTSGYVDVTLGDGLTLELERNNNIVKKAKNNLVYFRFTFLTTDNPALFDNHANNRFSVGRPHDFVFHYEDNYVQGTEINNPGNIAVGTTAKEKLVSIPGDTAFVWAYHFNLLTTNEGVNDLTLQIYHPPVIKINPNNRALLTWNNKEEKFLRSFVADSSKNLIGFTLPYIDPAAGKITYFQTWNDLIVNDELFPSHNIPQPFFTFIDLAFCPYDSCNATQNMTPKRYSFQIDIHPTFKMSTFDKPVRMKYLKTGMCLSSPMNSIINDTLITNSSQCLSSFVISKNGFIVSTRTNSYLTKSNLNEMVLKPIENVNDENSAKWMYWKNNLIWHTSTDFGVRWSHGIGETIKYEDYSTKVDQFKENEIKILEGWEDTSIPIKNVLYESTGSTLYACNPGGNLGNKYNCFYTRNYGVKWTRFPSVITTITYKTIGADELFGKCHRGKVFCQIVISTDEHVSITLLTETDWITKRFSGTNEQETNLDDKELNASPIKLWDDKDIAASSTGLYYQNADKWKKIFYWGH